MLTGESILIVSQPMNLVELELANFVLNDLAATERALVDF